jgi:hypothetical protein
MKVRVECYAGRKADERPIRFHLGGPDYVVEEIMDQWYGRDGCYFKVRAGDGFYILRCGEPGGEWSLESFRRASSFGTEADRGFG